jgi:hypothetical protein
METFYDIYQNYLKNPYGEINALPQVNPSSGIMNTIPQSEGRTVETITPIQTSIQQQLAPVGPFDAAINQYLQLPGLLSLALTMGKDYIGLTDAQKDLYGSLGFGYSDQSGLMKDKLGFNVMASNFLDPKSTSRSVYKDKLGYTDEELDKIRNDLAGVPTKTDMRQQQRDYDIAQTQRQQNYFDLADQGIMGIGLNPGAYAAHSLAAMGPAYDDSNQFSNDAGAFGGYNDFDGTEGTFSTDTSNTGASSGGVDSAGDGGDGYATGGIARKKYANGSMGINYVAPINTIPNITNIGTEELIQDYMNATQNRTNRLANPNMIQDLFNRYTGGGQRTYDQMIGSGQGDIRSSEIPFGIGSLLSRALPDRYYDMSLGDQAFTQSQMGYTGPTVFGQNTGNQDPFGMNVRSAFGNYGEAVQENFDSLNSSLSDRLAQKYGVTFDPNRGIYLGENADIANRQTQMMRDQFNFRKDQLVKRADIDSRSKDAIANKEKTAEIIRDNKQYFSGPKAKEGAFSPKTSRGRKDYGLGGRVGYAEGALLLLWQKSYFLREIF